MANSGVVFWQIYEYFQYVDKDEILNETISKVKSLPQDIKDSYKSLEERYEFLNAGINCDITRVCHLQIKNGACSVPFFSISMRFFL